MHKFLVRTAVVGAVGLAALGVNPPQAHAATFTKLTLTGGWQTYGGQAPAVTNDNGIIRFRGAMSTEAFEDEAFVLPPAFRPSGHVQLNIGVCNARKGAMTVRANGVVTVGSQTFADAQCFASLDGASFVKDAATATPLALSNGWEGGASGTRMPAGRVVNGVVNLVGYISTKGNTQLALRLPAALRPGKLVIMPTNACGAKKGTVVVEPDGDLFALGKDSPQDAFCGTSLEGVSFLKTTAEATPLPTQNGWGEYDDGTRAAFARKINGVVHLTGALVRHSGTSVVPFTLPASFRPTSHVFVAVTLCGGTNGRIMVAPNGTVVVDPEGAETDMTCLTSLEGATYAI